MIQHSIAYRAVEGAVRNALHGHPDWSVPPHFGHSVAKRAAGTLMAHAGSSLLASARRSGRRRKLTIGISASGGGVLRPGRLLSGLHREMTRAIAIVIQKGGDEHLQWALITAARTIKREIQRLEAKNNV